MQKKSKLWIEDESGSRDYKLIESIRQSEYMIDMIDEYLWYEDASVRKIKYWKDKIRNDKSTLWNSYQGLVFKMKYQLESMCSEYNISLENTEDYISMAYDTFDHVVNKIDMPRWEHLKSKAHIYQSLWGYLRSMNRDLLRKFFQNKNNNVRIYTSYNDDNDKDLLSNIDTSFNQDNDVQNTAYKTLAAEIFNDAIKLVESKMTPIQKKIWIRKKDGVSISKLCSDYTIKQKDLKQFIANTQKEIKKSIDIVSTQKNNKMSYDDIVKELIA